jgi:acetylornithine deacetylase
MPALLTAREMLARLVAFPTVSTESNLDLIGFVEDYLAIHGVPSIRVPDESGRKASLVALVGPRVEGGVVLSGHTDVVPVEGQDWSGDPFALREADGRLIGRGTCDMKGFCALALAAVPEMLRAGLKRPVVLALSYDEEIGCLGAPAMIETMLDALPRPGAVIVGEPTLMQVVSGHKAGVRLDTGVRGYEVHSSVMHTGVSAVMAAARLIAWLDARNAENRTRAEASGAGAGLDPPWTTLHVGRIAGGTANNITARDCRFVTEMRVMPDEEPDVWEERYRAEAERLAAGLRRVRPEAAIAIERINFVPPCVPERDGAAEKLVRELTGDREARMVSYGTEAGQFQEAGLSAVVCGPGSIAQAHQPDEYLTEAQFAEGEAFMRRLVRRLAA